MERQMERQCEALASGINWVGADNLFGTRFRERHFGPETTSTMDFGRANQ
jgi:hypothetical protein